MPDDLLSTARRQAEKADFSLRAAALLRIARAESAEDLSRARTTLLEGLELVRNLRGWGNRFLLEEARCVTAAVSPERLDELPTTPQGGHERFASGNLVRVMLDHGHVDAAVNYLLHYDDSESFPFAYVGNVFYELDRHSSNSADRRMSIVRHAFEVWRRSPIVRSPLQMGDFVQLFAHSWKELPPAEAVAVAHMIVERAAEEPDVGGSHGYPHKIHFTSPRQIHLFQILHVLRHLDPELAQSLVDSHDQLGIAARRFPNGLETMNEEAEAEAKRRKAEGVTCEGGYILMGDPADFDRQRKLIDASRKGDFETLIADAIEKYREDTSPENPNNAPKEYWPSTGAFRTVFYEAGKQLGAEGTRLLEQIPDEDLRLFATIELAAAVAGVPAASITQVKKPRPRDSSMFQGDVGRGGTLRPTMRSPDGRLIRCPKCLFAPPTGLLWSCKCRHRWNTFLTAGNCPACHFQWEITGCPSCGEVSEHQAWYVPKLQSHNETELQYCHCGPAAIGHWR